MSYKDIKLAEKAFRSAICGHAAQFDMDTIQRAESLLIQARMLADSDPAKSRSLAMDAQHIAIEAIEKTQTEKTRLKKVLENEVDSLMQVYSRHKLALSDIKKKIDNPTYLRITQRMDIAELCLKQAETGLEKEQFHAFPELCSRMRQRLLDVARVLNPVLDDLNYSATGKKNAKPLIR
jgi:hypothetical protein